ncbi:unnamed protein product [Rotaria magnacalcarata]|uniref:Cytochrome P450 n=2 Tax=Rotaria magnacalcarata TaxID=392030 RepID=A0A815C9P4_9BILA|nr:unnamed protein product [Rotaria magnacalcarata]CAF1375164.1 unnamed protein product [Rotaria magnacalcarata]CAF2036616.1 unnamed protein product [Rotaria magnacalcarata]CAF2056142.1 unnamed protein product [Rotaria magnacalcarata]CAF4072530.1 unnamed protein product [Rotaria magnacalcarata]
MILTIVLFSCFIFFIIVYLWTINNSYDYFKRSGIPGPPHRFFFGHYQDLWSVKSVSKRFQEWSRQYGSIYGLFVGTTPMYVVSDVDFLQEVYIKQFSSFHSRRLPILLRLQRGNRIHLFGATGLRWRRQRHVINPTFSAAKLKLMMPLVNKCIEAMLKKLSEIVCDKKQEINIYTLYKRMTMDVICHCAFGIDTDMQNDVDNIYLKKSAETFAVDVDKLFIVKMTDLFPFVVNPFCKFYLGQVAIRRLLIRLFPVLSKYIEETPGSWLTNHVRDVVNLRTSSSTATMIKRIDLLQLMIDASTTCDIHDHCDEEYTPKKLHEDEVVSNVFLFMIAGYETTSTALACSTYILATNPKVQDKLIEEIDQIKWDDRSHDEDTYELAMNLSYLEIFVREVLRMYPITTKGQVRQCNQTINIFGHIIEKNSIIQPDIFSIHYNPDLWGPEDPNLFIPERHLVKRHPIAWMPFGVGPRNCVGMRFALMELKMCLIELLQQYRILPSDRTEEGFQLREKLSIGPDAVFIKLEKRSA